MYVCTTHASLIRMSQKDKKDAGTDVRVVILFYILYFYFYFTLEMQDQGGCRHSG